MNEQALCRCIFTFIQPWAAVERLAIIIALKILHSHFHEDVGNFARFHIFSHSMQPVTTDSIGLDFVTDEEGILAVDELSS